MLAYDQAASSGTSRSTDGSSGDGRAERVVALAEAGQVADLAVVAR